jgi:hypothetical protein
MVPQSHVSERTKRKPSRISARTLVSAERSDLSGRERISSSATIETTNVPASTRNAVPAPADATTTPPTAGPTIWSMSGRIS